MKKELPMLTLNITNSGKMMRIKNQNSKEEWRDKMITLDNQSFLPNKPKVTTVRRSKSLMTKQ